MEKLKIGISIGDMNGIGLETIIKTFSDQRVLKQCIPVVYGSTKVVSYHKNIVGIDFRFNATRSAENLQHDKINVVNCWQDNVNITLGKASEIGGKCAYMSLDAATEDLKKGLIDALVTAPINKQAMKMADFPYPGHTEYLTDKFDAEESLMLMVSDGLRVGLVTNHLPVKDIAAAITKDLIVNKINIMNETLKMDFNIERPLIAVLGLNPHAGDEGAIGDEEINIIRPAIVECKKSGIMATGPFAADGFFGSGQFTKFDGILAMYHDQGLGPFKTLSLKHGINFTAGLPYVRTSPDHGTAFELAGKNESDPSSFRTAIFSALDICRTRKINLELQENALVKEDALADADDNDGVIIDD
ncbi:MAG: 4-hydroxythreonine-4-phosphate dehydrogenase PdxA [Bacteroidetes bacterium]|nr:MAG: 4-hydroxythreonine-4-phosphate dehydrogenase PdxA [Bacteroidota bacterium]